MKPLKIAVLALFILTAAIPASAQAKPAKKYYLALGDSLTAGVQPKASGANANTAKGFANQLARKAGVRLVNFGCGGATSGSLIDGSKKCSPARKPGYRNTSPKTSQLAAAESFLKKHKGKIAFLTIDIGANDVASCGAGGKIDGPCLTAGLARIKKYVPVIAKRLRKAAGKKLPMAVMTLYDPFLQLWYSNPAVAAASVQIAKTQVNDVLSKSFRKQGFKVADVAGAFGTYLPFSQTTTYNGRAGVPVAVANICRYTWMCAPAPRGPNIHANTKGYGVIAGAFRKALGKAAR